MAGAFFYADDGLQHLKAACQIFGGDEVRRSGTPLKPGPTMRSPWEGLSTNASPVLRAAAWTTSRALGLPENESQREALTKRFSGRRTRTAPLQAA